jgi:hypothetical protein
VCVWQWKTYQSVEVSPFPARYINGRAVHTRDVVYIFQRREKKKTFQLLYHFPFTSLFVCTHVLWRTLHTLTNNLLFYLFLFLSLLPSYLEAFDIHPSYSFPLCICFCVTMASCYEALNVNDPDCFTLSPVFRELSRSHQPKSGGGGWTLAVEFACPVVLTLSFSSSSALQRNT